MTFVKAVAVIIYDQRPSFMILNEIKVDARRSPCTLSCVGSLSPRLPTIEAPTPREILDALVGKRTHTTTVMERCTFLGDGCGLRWASENSSRADPESLGTCRSPSLLPTEFRELAF